MDDLIAFLRARLDEDEAAARKAHDAGLNGVSPYAPQTWYLSDSESLWSEPDGVCLATGAHGYLGNEVGDHIVRHDPARVLAEVDAKRRIIERHKPTTEVWDQGDGPFEVKLCERCAYGESCNHCFDREDLPLVAWPCPEVRLLALPYASHPDYREEWRP